MKKHILLTLMIIIAAGMAVAQTGQRKRAAERIREARASKGENPGGSGGSYVVGKNRFTTQVNGDTREYYVHVPKSYNKSTAVPFVIMLHGTSGNGLKFYNISGWKELGETENILTAYPSSWHHCIVEDGQRKNTTKWNVYPGSFEYCPGEVPKDDVKFLNQLIDEVSAKFTVNPKMVYIAGFSNGGQMSARAGVEMSNRVAAVVSASGPLAPGTSFVPQRLLPNLFQVGTDDDRFMATNGGKPLPMNFDQLFAGSAYMKAVLATYVATYKLNASYTTGGDPNKIVTLDDRGVSGRPSNVLRMAIIKGMTHLYPNGKNFPINGTRLNWEWLKQYKLP